MGYLVVAYIVSVFVFIFGIVFIVRKRTPFSTSEGPPSFRTTSWYYVRGVWAKVIGFVWLTPLPVLVLCHLLIPGELLAGAVWAVYAGMCLLVHKLIGWLVGT
jgi:hypothetical protein